jgi:hypothetical protein
VDQVKSEEFEYDDTPIRRSKPSWLGSICASSTEFEVEPSIRRAQEDKGDPKIILNIVCEYQKFLYLFEVCIDVNLVAQLEREC